MNTEEPTLYAYSTNEEDYTDGRFETPEEAAQVAFEDDDELTRVYVGEIVKPQLHHYINAVSLLESITEGNAEQFGGEWCHHWIEKLYAPKAAIAELDELLTDIVGKWVERHGLQCTFFNVENVKDFTRHQILPSRNAKPEGGK